MGHCPLDPGGQGAVRPSARHLRAQATTESRKASPPEKSAARQVDACPSPATGPATTSEITRTAATLSPPQSSPSMCPPPPPLTGGAAAARAGARAQPRGRGGDTHTRDGTPSAGDHRAVPRSARAHAPALLPQCCSLAVSATSRVGAAGSGAVFDAVSSACSVLLLASHQVQQQYSDLKRSVCTAGLGTDSRLSPSHTKRKAASPIAGAHSLPHDLPPS